MYVRKELLRKSYSFSSRAVRVDKQRKGESDRDRDRLKRQY